MATKINADRSSDPSDYEKIRMLNIERNEAFLQQIGVAAIKPIAAKHKNGKRKIINTTKEALSPVRRSSRISLIPQPSYLEERIYSAPKTSVMDASEDLLVGTEVGTEIEPSQPVASKPLSVATIFGPKRCNEVNADYYCTFLAVAEATGPQRQKQEQQGIPLCTPVAQYGKAAVMALSNGGTAPRFSKYVGAVEWRNCVYLWVNVGGAHSSEYEYPNTFSEQGRHMMWFGGSRMHADSGIVRRLLLAKAATSLEQTGTGLAAGAEAETEAEAGAVLLFVRLEGEGYCCLGRVRWVAADLGARPVRFKWQLLDHALFARSEHFQRILHAAGATSS